MEPRRDNLRVEGLMFCDGLALGVVEYQISTLWTEKERQTGFAGYLLGIAIRKGGHLDCARQRYI